MRREEWAANANAYQKIGMRHVADAIREALNDTKNAKRVNIVIDLSKLVRRD